MVLGTTTTAQVINPQVMADMVSAKLPKLIKFTPLAVVETTLVGRPGDELTVPQWTYSGDETNITDTGDGGYYGGYYYRHFEFGQFGTVWLSCWDKEDLDNY